MSHSLVETPAWAATVTVPDASDSGETRHVAAEVTAQSLANRTAYLKNLAENAVPDTGGSITGNLSMTGDLTCDDITCDDINCDDLSADAITSASVATGPLTATTINTTASINTVASVNAGFNIETTAGDIKLPAGSGYRVKYTGTDTDKRRIIRCRLSSAASTQPTLMQFNGVNWGSFSTSYILSIPLPQLSTLSTIEQIWITYEASGATAQAELIRHHVGDWLISPGATPTATQIGTVNLTTGAGVRKAYMTLGSPEVISNASYDYYIRITGAGSSTHTIWAAAVVALLYSPGID